MGRVKKCLWSFMCNLFKKRETLGRKKFRDKALLLLIEFYAFVFFSIICHDKVAYTLECSETNGLKLRELSNCIVLIVIFNLKFSLVMKVEDYTC